MSSVLERAFRRTLDRTFHQAVAFGTLSILGTLLSIPVVTVGPAIFGVAHAIVTTSRRGAQHTVRETVQLFGEGARLYAREGLALSVFLLFLVGVLFANGLVLFAGNAVWIGVVAVLSIAVAAGCLLVVMHAVTLVVCGVTPRSSLRDGTLLLFKHPGVTVGQSIVVGSVFVLGTLTMVGWLLVGFALAVSFSLRATDGLYQAIDGNSPINQ